MRIGQEMRKAVQNSLPLRRLAVERIIKAEACICEAVREDGSRADDVNLKSMFLTCKHVLSHMDRRGQRSDFQYRFGLGHPLAGVPYISLRGD
jgi:hypothetical protein